ncbi:MAG TPA: ferredoxin family protein [Ilumatobacteraceae bacterium]|nr:ferredoxin family protein [Ilumatobacteraceae bacterium]
MPDVAVITEACIGTKDRACVDVCPVQCIYEFNPAQSQLFSEEQAGSGEVANTHTANPEMVGVFADTILYVNHDECTACAACYEPGVCPVGAIYSLDKVPDGTSNGAYNADDTSKGHDHRFFIELSKGVFAD